MDAILDLAARAAAFIVVVQQLCVDYPDTCDSPDTFHLLHPDDKIRQLIQDRGSADPVFREKSIQLLLISNSAPEKDGIAQALVRRELAILEWIWDPVNLILLTDDQDQIDSLPSEERWRSKLNRLLYERPEQRLPLAQKLKYLPIQIVLATGGNREGSLMQRLLQEYETSPDELQELVSAADLRLFAKSGKLDLNLAVELLGNRDTLHKELIQEQVPLPFEAIFSQELKDIEDNRLKRMKELRLLNPAANTARPIHRSAFSKFYHTEDPMETAKAMGLHSIAFSGGGIRSATFNLGVLQGFAKAGLLSKFDYLSAVSGGGYIGSWFVAWIKRAASVRKVSDQLNSEKSPDPTAEEVRPIRWLRMYSNYLSPSRGIMTLDSWTMGMTITRNMLLNQVLILLMLLCLLVLGRALFNLWNSYIQQMPNLWMAYLAAGFIILGSVLAGAGMYFHDKQERSRSPVPGLNSLPDAMRNLMLYIAYLAAFTGSAWFFKKAYPLEHHDAFKQALLYLSPLCGLTFLGLTFIAVLGRYDQCIPASTASKSIGILLIGLFSLLAACAGLVFLVLGWKAISILQQYGERFITNDNNYSQELGFTFGPPLVIEVLALTIVTRMALLGIYFPDNRREWWARIGAVVHRLAFLWIIVAAATLLGGPVITYIRELTPNLGVAFGGWAALVLGAVKAAFSSRSDNSKSGITPKLLSIAAVSGPYLFIAGLLVFLPMLLNTGLNYFFPVSKNEFFFLLGLTAVLALATCLLSWRIGVNEFSMHHFYKNRLVRAYLGATINRQHRKETRNPFTGFNAEDDLLLSSLSNANGYFGPYPLINTTLNATQAAELDRQDRKGESFVFTPLYCGFDFSKTQPSGHLSQKSYDYGYRPTSSFAYPDHGPHLGSAMAISGAAANPNQGSHSSAAVAFLLTAFNVRLGWWIGNPRKRTWRSSNPNIGLPYLFSNLFGKSNTKDRFICLSDGGHFENMGLYELVRRRSLLIVLGDAEQDDQFTCEGLANAIRRCRIDFGVEININVLPITDRQGGISQRSYAIGDIRYPGDKPFVGTLIYIKASITKDLPTDVREYAAKNPIFPHQSTGDQFFDETQFESYRKLGLHITEMALNDAKVKKIFFPQANGETKQHNPGSLVV
jgi:hypothetical protein